MKAAELVPSDNCPSTGSSSYTDAARTEDISLGRRFDHATYETLFQQYKEDILRYEYSLVRDIEDAHDLTQKTFMRAWEKLPTLKEKSRFLPWLYRIARNAAYDHWRSKKRALLSPWETLTQQQGMLSVQGPEEVVEVVELARLALAALPPKYQACLLYTIYGFSKQEIANLVGISKASVTPYLCSARSQFRQAYLQLKCE